MGDQPDSLPAQPADQPTVDNSPTPTETIDVGDSNQVSATVSDLESMTNQRLESVAP
jgi:hypothetical protein